MKQNAGDTSVICHMKAIIRWGLGEHEWCDQGNIVEENSSHYKAGETNAIVKDKIFGLPGDLTKMLKHIAIEVKASQLSGGAKG